MKKNILCLIIGTVVGCLLFTGCEKESTKDNEILSTTAELNSSEEEAITSNMTDEIKSESETTTEQPTTTLKQEEPTTKIEEITAKEQETTTAKKQETTTKQEETTKKSDNSDEINENYDDWEYTDEERTFVNTVLSDIIDKNMSEFEKVKAINDYIVMNIEQKYKGYFGSGISVKKAGIEALKSKKASFNTKATVFKILCDMANIESVFVCGSIIYGESSYDTTWNQVRIDGKWYNIDVRGFSDINESYSSFCLSDEDMYSTDLRIHYKTTYKPNTCNSTSLDLLAMQTGVPWEWNAAYVMIESEEEMTNYIKEIIENGSTQIAYMYKRDEEVLNSLAYIALNSIDFQNTKWSIDGVAYEYKGYSVQVSIYEECPYTICKTIQGSEALKEYIYDCIENETWCSNVYVIENDFLWDDFVKEIGAELYWKHGAIVEDVYWDDSIQEELPEGYSYFSLKITVDETFDSYQKFVSKQEAIDYINECLIQGQTQISLYLRLEQFEDESMTDFDKWNTVQDMLEEIGMFCYCNQYRTGVDAFYDCVRINIELFQ